MAYQADDLLSPRGAGLDVRADENVVIPGLEIVDEVVGRLFLVRTSHRRHSTGGADNAARVSSWQLSTNKREILPVPILQAIAIRALLLLKPLCSAMCTRQHFLFISSPKQKQVINSPYS